MTTNGQHVDFDCFQLPFLLFLNKFNVHCRVGGYEQSLQYHQFKCLYHNDDDND